MCDPGSVFACAALCVEVGIFIKRRVAPARPDSTSAQHCTFALVFFSFFALLILLAQSRLRHRHDV